MAEQELKTQSAQATGLTDEEHEHLGGERFNRRLLVIAGAFAVVVGVIAGEGIRSAGVKTSSAGTQLSTDNTVDAERHKAEVADLATGTTKPMALPMPGAIAVIPIAKSQTPQSPPAHEARTPSRYAQWAEDKRMRALEAPQMVAAFHSGGTLEIANAPVAHGEEGGSFDTGTSTEPTVRLRPPSPYTVVAGSVIPAVLVSGIDSDLPGPILAQVSENVFDSASGRSLLIPQGSKLIGTSSSTSASGQQRIQIAWRRLIFPNTASMDLPQMPGTDQSGYAGFTDQVNNHYLATFGTAAVTSLISAGQMVGQMGAFGGGGTYGPYGYYQPNQWATAGETAGSAASAQMGALGQQRLSNGMDRPPTIEIRPGYQFDVMVTEDLVFPGPSQQ
jgi:type IV secretory pathway VirB10-like protein